MKQPALRFALAAMLSLSLFCCREKQDASPAAAIRPPCDSSVIKAVQNWFNTLDTLKPDTAAAHLEKIFREGGDCYNSLVAEAWHKLGNKYEKSDYPKARGYFQKALSLRLPVLGKHHKDVMRAYHMMGCMYAEEKDYHTALAYYDSAGVWTQDASIVPHIRNLLMTGVAYKELKEFGRAKMYLQAANDSITIKGGISKRWQSDALLHYSSCCRASHQYAEAIEKGKESLKCASVADNPILQKASANLAIGNAYQDSALHCTDPGIRQQLFQEAIFYSKKAKEIYQSLSNGGDLTMRTVGNIGELYRRAGQFGEALTVLSEVLDTQPDKKKPDLGQLYINRGETWAGKGNLEQALGDYDAALRCLMPAYQPGGALPSLDSFIYDRSALLMLLGDMASAYMDKAGHNQAYLNKAAATFDYLLTLLNVVRGDFLSDEAKVELAGDSRNILDKAFGGYLQLYRLTKQAKYLEQAFNISEQRKSFALLEAARLNNADANLPADLRQEKRALAKEQSRIEQEMVASWNNPEAKKNLTAAQRDNLEQSRAFQQKIKKLYPKYYELRHKGAELSIPAIQEKMLGEGQALLEYFCRDTVLEIFLITKTSLKNYTSPIERSSFERTVNNFLQLSAKPGSRGEGNASREEQLCGKAYELYRTLLQPLEKDLPKRIVVIPDAPFQTLPFEALAMNPATGGIRQQIKDSNFVLFAHSVSYCFSANLLWEMQQSKVSAQLKSEVAAFAPRFPEHLKAGANLPASFVQTVHDLKPLGNKREVEEIDRRVSVQPYTDADATKENFFEACNHYAFVHVATHGILNQDPNLNFVAFSQKGDSLDQTELLFLGELYAQRLPQDLVVFSACETALGQYREGEGNISMARGLAYAGVRSFVTTLWKVPTDANRQIMPEFYEQFLTNKEPKDVALAKARRAFIALSPDNEQLDQWAGLVLIGSAERAQQSGGWMQWAFALAAAAGLLWFGVKRRRRTTAHSLKH